MSAHQQQTQSKNPETEQSQNKAKAVYPLSDPAQRQALHAIKTSKRVAQAKEWVQRLNSPARVLQQSPAQTIAQTPAGVAQLAIEVQSKDFDPRPGHGALDGYINENQFYTDLSTAINNAGGIHAGHKNIRNNVLQTVRQHDYQHPDIPTIRDAIANAISAEYGVQGRPLQANAVRGMIETALVNNIQADHQRDMNQHEAQAFDVLKQRPNVVMSRSKGAPSTIPHGSLPAGLQANVNAVLAEIRAERALWNQAAITTQMVINAPANFSAAIAHRQGGLSYQGNHTNNAGWLPAGNAPVNEVAGIVDRIYAAAKPGLKTRLIDANPLRRLDHPDGGFGGRHNKHRTEFDALKNQEINALTNAQIKLSAMAALCQGVSPYIEFNMPGHISRLMYNPVTDTVYITAHYKWREGYNPFFQVIGFPAV